MNISDLEKMVREGVKAGQGESALAFVADNSGTVPSEYAEAAKSLASRSGAPAQEASEKDAEQKPWI